MTRRSRMEIYMDILKVVADGKEKPTHIMYRANLSWQRLQKCLDLLLSQDLLQKKIDGEKPVYSLSQKGREILIYYMKIVGELSQKKTAPQILARAAL